MKQALIHGKIYQGSGAFCEALLIENGTILQAGRTEDIAPCADTVFDLQGRVVLPGFNDSHLHAMMVGETLCDVDLSACRSIADIQQAIRAYLDTHQGATLVHGIGWNQDQLEERRCLERHDLDAVSATIPMVMERVCTHVLTVNTAMKNKVNLVDEDFDPDTGIAQENACAPFLRDVRDKSEATILNQLETVAAHCLRHGITSIQTADIKDGNFERVFAAYARFAARQTLRITHQFHIEDIPTLERFLRTCQPRTTRFHRIGPIKAFMDGSLGARTAWLSSPYRDDPSTCGIQVTTAQKFQELAVYAKKKRLPLITHAIGDAAIACVLDQYEALQEPGNPLRWGVVHVQITGRDLLERFRSQNIVAYIQPVFLEYDLHIVEERVGKTLAATSYAFETLHDFGVPLCLGTDAPVESVDPFKNLHCAVFRQDYDRYPKNGWNAQERLSLEDAIDAYTQGSAFAQGMEKKLGKLEPGYWADLIVIDHDIFQDPKTLLETKALKTMCHGKWVYSR